MSDKNAHRMEQALLQRFDLTGKAAAITGAGGELCGAMAEALGAIGVKVAVLDISLEKAEVRAQSVIRSGGIATALQCDVLDPVRLRECCKEVSHLWGAPDFLINGAGGNDPRAAHRWNSTTQMAPVVRRCSRFSISIRPVSARYSTSISWGLFLPPRPLPRGMVAKGKGSIVNISSMSAFLPLTKVAAYSAAKAAVSNFTKWLAVHFSQTGVRVNALAPGFFMTEQLRFLHIDQNTGELTPRARQVVAHTPLRRYGHPDDLIGALIWLLSDASSFVTGVVVPVDGGFSSYSI